jgi:hypothetical protein
MKKKLLFIMLFVLTIFVSGCTKEECTSRSIDQTMYVSADVLVKFSFKENYDFCKKGDEKYNKNEKEVVTNFELVNDKAKSVFEGVDLKDKSLKEALDLFGKTLDSKGVSVEQADIYTTSKNDYSSYLMYNVTNTVLDKNEIDTRVNKKIPLTNYQIRVDVGMEYYFQNYNFLSNEEVYVYADSLEFTTSDSGNTFKYLSDYDIKNDTIKITILNTLSGYKNYFLYKFADNSFTYLSSEQME